MADEIIKLFEYFTGSPVIQGWLTMYIIAAALFALLVVGIIILTICTIFRRQRRWRH